MFLKQALFLCNICVVFRLVLALRDLLFIHALTNATEDHKYSPLPSADFDSYGVLVSFITIIFWKNDSYGVLVSFVTIIFWENVPFNF